MAEPQRFEVRAPRGWWGVFCWRLFLASIILPPLLMAVIWAGFATLPALSERPVRDMRDLLEALLYTLCFLAGLVAVPLTGLLALLTRGRTLVIERAPPPA